MEKLKLPNVMLIAMTSVNVEGTMKALEYSSSIIEFGEVKLISHYKPASMSAHIKYEYIDKIKSIDDWSYNIIYNLPKYVNNTSSDITHIFLAHADGFPVNPESWKDEFLLYDFIGSPFPLPQDDFSYRDIHGNIIRVGNSVSLRSKKLVNLPVDLNLEWKPFHNFFNEDGYVCCGYRNVYLEHGMKFADIDIAKYFGHETMIPEIVGIKPFCFHKHAGTNNIYPRF